MLSGGHFCIVAATCRPTRSSCDCVCSQPVRALGQHQLLDERRKIGQRASTASRHGRMAAIMGANRSSRHRENAG
jgi:hypothetical protein